MGITIDRQRAVPLHQQIAECIRRMVALGQTKAGERLPSIRSLAIQLGVDAGTVARAYRELEQEGTIITCGRNGSFITERGRRQKPDSDRLVTVMDRAILEALALGFNTAEIESTFASRLTTIMMQHSHQQSRVSDGAQTGVVRFSGSHDLSLGILIAHTRSLYPNIRFETSFTGSLAGLVALECGQADIAGSHLLDEESGEFNIPFIRRLMPAESVVVINLVQRMQGLMVAPGNPKQVINLTDLRRPDVAFVNRQKGSGTRIYLDRQLLRLGIKPSEIRGYEREESTHVAVAAAVARGIADAGIGTQSAAASAGLDFIPLLKERYDLVCLKDNFDRSPLIWIAMTVRSPEFKLMLGSLPGYDISLTGEVTFIQPAANTAPSPQKPISELKGQNLS